MTDALLADEKDRLLGIRWLSKGGLLESAKRIMEREPVKVRPALGRRRRGLDTRVVENTNQDITLMGC